MTFTCNARYFLVTYSHVQSLDPFRIVDHFGGLGAEVIVSLEQYHETLGVHFHVFADFGRKFRSRRADIFDVDGFHPNISPSRGTPEAGFDYAIKDGDVVAGGLARPCGVVALNRSEKWHKIERAETRDEFFSLCAELDPERLVCSFSQIQKFADWRFAVEPKPYASPDGVFDLANYGDLTEWRDNFLFADTTGRYVQPLCRGNPLPPGGSLSLAPHPPLSLQFQMWIRADWLDPSPSFYGGQAEWGRPCGQGHLENISTSAGYSPLETLEMTELDLQCLMTSPGESSSSRDSKIG